MASEIERAIDAFDQAIRRQGLMDGEICTRQFAERLRADIASARIALIVLIAQNDDRTARLEAVVAAARGIFERPEMHPGSWTVIRNRRRLKCALDALDAQAGPTEGPNE